MPNCLGLIKKYRKSRIRDLNKERSTKIMDFGHPTVRLHQPLPLLKYCPDGNVHPPLNNI